MTPADDTRPTVYYDGVCGVCSAIAAFIRKRDTRGRFRLVAIQSAEASERLAPLGIDTEDPSTMVLAEGAEVWTRSDAALRVARDLRFPWTLAWALRVVPRPLRDSVYDLFARNRHRLPGPQASCSIADNTDGAAT